MLPASRREVLERIRDTDLVLDVGGWAKPFTRADWVIDLLPYETRGLYGYDRDSEADAERFSAATWVERDICAREPWPFADDQFDFAVCSHTLEDIRDPVWVCHEIARVAKAGYVEVPSRLEEQAYGIQGSWAGWGHHHWLVDVRDGGLEFVFKHHVLHGERRFQLAREDWEALPAEWRVETFWWEGRFEAGERVFIGSGELERYLEEISQRQAELGTAAGPDVSVIVSARDAESTVATLLDALQRQEGAPDFEIIFVDNGSRDATAEAVLAHSASVRLVRRSRGEGPGPGRNAGAAIARGSSYAFTDADCAPAPGWIRAGVEAMREASLVQGAVRPPEGAEPGPFDRTLWVQNDSGLYQTASLFVKRDVFETVGGFPDPERGADERPFGEDVEFAWRARRAGARATFAPGALVYHAVFPRGGRAFAREAWRRRFFPDLVRRAPELRETFCYRGLFLSSRTATFDLAVLGVAAALIMVLLGILPFTLLLVAPYARVIARDAWRWRGGPRRLLAVVAVGMVADAVSLAALALGSVRARTILL